MSGLINWPDYGARRDDPSKASANVEAFNRACHDQHVASGKAGGVYVPAGKWYINDQLHIEREQVLRGQSPTASSIVATPDFPFDDTGEVAMLHPQNEGNVVGYGAVNNTTRVFIDGVRFDGAGVPNSCGVLLKSQQPAYIRGLRVDGCRGKYGLCVMGQDSLFTNIELIGNTVPLRMREAKLMKFRGLNIEQTKGSASVVFDDGYASMWDTFEGVHLEHDQETIGFDVRGGATALAVRDLYYANPNTGTCLRFDTPIANPGSSCRYVLENIWCNTPDNAYKMVEDVQRGKSLNSFSDTDRWIDYLTPRVLMAGYVKTP